jgi:AcrR family transcriptional regulator
MKSSLSRPRSYHHGDLRRALLDAALDLIRASGPAAFTLRQAAVRAGVSHNAPYRHFPDKASLLAELAEEGSVALREAADRAVAAAGEDPVERLRAVGMAYIRFAVAQPGHFRVMFDTARSPESVPSQGTTFELLVECITVCQDCGRFKQVGPLDIALPAWAVVHGLAMLLVDDMLSSCNFDKSIDQMAWTVTQVIFDAFSV